MRTPDDLQQLFEKYRSGTCTRAEKHRLVRFLRTDYGRVLLEQLIDRQLRAVNDADIPQETLDRIFQRLDLRAETPRQPRRLFRWTNVAAATVTFMAIAVSAYFLWVRWTYQPESERHVRNEDVAPGGNRATLLIEGGDVIELSSDCSGIVIADGQIAYDNGTKVTQAASAIHKLITPKGGQYQITLHDGTKVWLNAHSTLSYPGRFSPDERVVELEGEAYFEVSKWLHGNKRVPFRIKTRDQVVEVLGTQLNINAYRDEQTTATTLIEGAVRVITSHSSTSLKPGQQCRVTAEGLSVSEVDVELVVDWKNGDFIFQNETLKSIMRKIARWYDVAVVYEREIPDEHFNGQISRNKKLSEVLRILELSGGLTTRIKDNTLYLSPGPAHRPDGKPILTGNRL